VVFLLSLSLPLSPGPDCLRALRTATRQNICMERKRRNWRSENHIKLKLCDKIMNLQSTEDPRPVIQATVQQITLYLRGLYFRKVTG